MTHSDAERTVRGVSIDGEGDGDADIERAGARVGEKKETEKDGSLTLDPNECRFEGEDDVDDPLNIPFWKKWLAVITVGTGAICV